MPEPKQPRLTPEEHVMRFFTSKDTTDAQVEAMLYRLTPLLEYRMGCSPLPQKPGRKRKAKPAPLLEQTGSTKRLPMPTFSA